jgi:hypothetical protein
LGGKRPQKEIRVLNDIVEAYGLHDLPELLCAYSQHTLAEGEKLDRDVQCLLWYPAELFSFLRVPVARFQGEDGHVMHTVRSTGPKNYRGGSARNDWVWICMGNKKLYKGLRGRLPARVLALFKLRHPSIPKTYKLAMIDLLTAGPRGGEPDPISGLITVSRGPQTASRRRVVDIGCILGIAHLIPESGEEDDNKWLVNNRIDLDIYNTIYY